MTPVQCPICTRSSLEPVSQNVAIEAEIDNQPVNGALMAFRCTEFGHLFLVRKSDVEADAKLNFAP